MAEQDNHLLDPNDDKAGHLISEVCVEIYSIGIRAILLSVMIRADASRFKRMGYPVRSSEVCP